jgi:hypothetical protein
MGQTTAIDSAFGVGLFHEVVAVEHHLVVFVQLVFADQFFGRYRGGLILHTAAIPAGQEALTAAAGSEAVG